MTLGRHLGPWARDILAAYTPSIHLFFNLSMQDDDAVFWSPSNWAWVGGLLDMLFPAWMAGRPVATSLHRFGADQAFGFMARHRVTHAFLAPTAIKRLAQTAHPRDAYDLALRVICTGGESLAWIYDCIWLSANLTCLENAWILVGNNVTRRTHRN